MIWCSVRLHRQLRFRGLSLRWGWLSPFRSVAVCVPASPPPAIVDEEERLALALVLMHAASAVHPAVARLVSVSTQWRGLALAAPPIF